MRIEDIKTKLLQDIKNKKKTSNSSSNFGSFLIDNDENSQIIDIQNFAQINNFLSVDEIIDNYKDSERLSKKYGFDLLDLLDKFKLAILNDKLSLSQIENMKDFLQNKNITSDPKLKEILNEIELRLAVEIAKIEKYSK